MERTKHTQTEGKETSVDDECQTAMKRAIKMTTAFSSPSLRHCSPRQHACTEKQKVASKELN